MSDSAEGISREVLQRYLAARAAIAECSDRIVGVVHLLGLLRHCGEDSIPVSPSALASMADLIDQDICGIQEQLDEFVYLLDAEELVAE